jgi:DNA (cytosine-5)-methyltransferase 1
MKILDLFSGIGGFSLGLERAGMETVAFCEIDPFCREVLKKHWPDIPIYEDVRKLKGGEIAADIICGGYPCQPFSVAGKRKGEEDDRHLWPEVARLLSEVRPRWFIGENVAGHISMGLDEVLFDLEGQGYDAQTFVIPACAVDAPHRRDRVWIVAWNAHSGRRDKREVGKVQERKNTKPDGVCTNVPDTQSKYDGSSNPRESKGQIQQFGISDFKADVADTEYYGSCGEKGNETIKGSNWQKNGIFERGCAWPTEPDVGRVANGIPRRMDRLRSLGNAVVPQIPEMIGRAIMEIERINNES